MNRDHEYLHLILNGALNGLWNAIEGEINHLCPNVQSMSRDISIKTKLAYKLFFLGFPPPKAVEARSAAGETYTNCSCLPGRRHCNKLGSQAPRRGMLFWPILQHCSISIDLLGDCSNS